MSTVKVRVPPEVLTLEEAANYLRLPRPRLRRLAAEGQLPGRQVEREWRFLKSALDDWLRGPDAKTRLVRQAGALADDEMLDELRSTIYVQRGRPEVEEERPGA